MPNEMSLSPHSLLAAVVSSLREHWRPLVAYHLFFTLLAATVFLPASASALAALLKRIGRPVFTNSQLLDVALSPLGLLWLLAAIGLTFLLLFLQQAGMILMAVRPGGHRYRVALEALWTVARRFPGVALLSLWQVGAHLLLALPLLLALTGLYDLWLGDLPSYYIWQVRPTALWFFFASGTLPVLIWLWLAARLYLRWSLALPVLILEDLSPRRSLARSHALTDGVKRRLMLPIAMPLAIIIALPILATALFDLLTTPLLEWLPENSAVLIPAMLGYLTAYGVLTLAITFIGVAANSLLSGCLYLRLAHRLPKLPTPPANAHPGWVAWGAELLVVAFAITQASLVLNSFEIRDRVIITAHRGSSWKAPENTLAAIEQAIEDGADYVEFDVRLTADDAIVVSHDDSLRRLTGHAQSLSEMTLKQARQIDVGSWFDDAFAGQRIPTFEEVLELTRHRAGLYIELKPGPGEARQLVARVLEELPEARRDEAVMASLSPVVIREVNRQAPDMRTTLFAQFVLRGGLNLTTIDALGLRHNRVTEDAVEAAHHYGYQLHAWTVNSRGQMSRLIDLGVDNIITDRPALLSEVLAERAALSDGELLLVKLRNWLHS
nr:glycerophosphodiester phosphodiesterase family protein [uncultured Halomonas sp.]